MTTRDSRYESRDELQMDVDRMVNEGLAGGYTSAGNGSIGLTTTDTMSEWETYFEETTEG